ncbi:FadR/GntR family transcriptional regulator [uncultured Nocardioides sp.]|uniref:FadR/GntR family transcriptional regulator n=1 Tax=uncultured Nocardioides sp. TaxID=198441 RepID=UPI002635EB04|nr:FCD domain-containing protein [uncultured Nocardioides sp.]
MSPSPRPATSGGRHADVLDALGGDIAAARLAEGEVLTVEGICARYAVSRSVAREAIRVLEAMGMLAARRRVGITVQPRAGWSVFDPRLIRWRLDEGDRADQLLSLSELRRGVEPAAAALAAARADAEQCKALAGAVSDMQVHARTGDLEPYLRADQTFHRVLLEASGNEMFAALVDVVVEVLSGRTQHGMMPARPNPEAVALHDDVARAVRLGDVALAQASMTSIIDEAADALASGR